METLAGGSWAPIHCMGRSQKPILHSDSQTPELPSNPVGFILLKNTISPSLTSNIQVMSSPTPCYVSLSLKMLSLLLTLSLPLLLWWPWSHGRSNLQWKKDQQTQPNPGCGPANYLFVTHSIHSHVLLWVHAFRSACYPGLNRPLNRETFLMAVHELRHPWLCDFLFSVHFWVRLLLDLQLGLPHSKR